MPLKKVLHYDSNDYVDQDHLKGYVWGKVYGAHYPSDDFMETLNSFQRNGLMSGSVVDFGSGKHPVTRELDTTRSKILLLDRAGEEGRDGNRLRVKLDVEDIFRYRERTRDVLRSAFRFFGEPQADNFVFSHILRYVDYKQVLSGLLPHLKRGGLMHIYDKIGVGDELFLHDTSSDTESQLLPKEGLKSIEGLARFLEANSCATTVLRGGGDRPFVMRSKKM